ncbi:GNAT family N-acetyltransferase [Ferrimonas marina]|uniref:Ribosomal protein S18 acetylase RimI n=1 Tax=Ferrimonas marina TaxID=299255 RepID=A0A1M5RC96_9GAMM|nr:GNAT family N-acetyltransferase [Ferrimonas marina]SHH23891.1 Ribosomal protein S18 acetylase RimI [Ferrimonas marina]
MEIRLAKHGDIEAIVPLMNQLGYSVTVALIQEKLRSLSDSPFDRVFVAVYDGQIVGVVSCHLTNLLHQAGYCGRITSLVIDENHRGLGTGKALLQAAESYFVESGCYKVEVTSSEHRNAAHEFYRACGYQVHGLRFLKVWDTQAESMQGIR